MNKIKDTKYFQVAEDVVRIHTESGVKISGSYEDYGLNQYEKSKKGIEFDFYWSGLSSVRTPIGSIHFGSKSGNGLTFPLAQKELISYFGLELISQKDGMTGERWFLYQATKNIPQ